MDRVFGRPAAGMTCYLRVLPDCHASANLMVGRGVLVRHLPAAEVKSIRDQLQRRNVFVRHGGGDFYTHVLGQMSDRTVVDISVTGEPEGVAAYASSLASLVEDLVLVAASLGMARSAIAKRVQPRDLATRRLELAIGPQFRQLRARSARPRGKAEVVLDASFGKRFAKHGFPNLYQLCASQTNMGDRVRHAVRWLKEAMCEEDLPSAVIHVAIALETMLVFSESESLARSLGERVAFLLADTERMRASIDATVKRFYDVRSGVAHGSRRKLRHLSVRLIDGVTRLAVLALCVIAANRNLWGTPEALRDWFARERWVAPSVLDRPTGGGAVRRALALSATD